ncbi:glycosyl transferase family 1 [uncultured Desulfovibrio sp.]|uniref:glycosyl transferase family 1 n=1 Tax=uncultured Desulfovibrio sp. TaxID=167968 RepID=UPI00262A68A2|nr:glycosyl transferase family 1 [uncultured Desulfovibrio sp.]
MSRPILWLATSLDVEEEGLFGGTYACTAPSVSNTAQLTRLRPLLERGVRPTLFCAHSVLTHSPSLAVLAHLRDRYGAEIAAHLHHWNTPPLDNGSVSLHAVPAASLSSDRFAAKLESLLRAGQTFQGAPLRSFRMGRWDLHRQHWPLLAAAGLTCDASVRPLHGPACNRQGLRTLPDHFHAPRQPYTVRTAHGALLEVPLSVTPLVPGLDRGMSLLPARMQQGLRARFHQWGALALLPVQHPLWLMQHMTRTFVRRGGRVLSLTWHSSEMMPGATPHLPHEPAVRALLHRLTAYVDWLSGLGEVRHVTMQELVLQYGNTAPAPAGDASADWTCSAPVTS